MRTADPIRASQQEICESQSALTSRASRTREIRTEQHNLLEKTLSHRNCRGYEKPQSAREEIKYLFRS